MLSQNAENHTNNYPTTYGINYRILGYSYGFCLQHSAKFTVL